MRLRFDEVLAATGARPLRGEGHVGFDGVSTDSRQVAGGELFLALSGPSFDGNRFARGAVDAGAGGLLLRDEPGLDLTGVPDGVPVAACREPLRALADLARWHRERLDCHVIGITGSVGKTSTKNVLVEMLRDRMEVVGSPASYNNEIGVPRTLLLADDRTRALVCEIGTNAPGEIAHLCRIARPTAAIVTEVGTSHLEGLGSVEGVAAEKGALPASLPKDGFCVLNADNPLVAGMADLTAARTITFGLREGVDADLTASDIVFDARGTRFVLGGRSAVATLGTDVDGRTLRLPLLGEPAVKNALAALAACLGLGFDLDAVLPALERLVPSARRLQPLEAGGRTVIDDSYNANPESTRAGLRVLRGLTGHARRVMVLGDMLELGRDAGVLHHAIGRDAAEAGIDLLVLVGELTRATAAGAVEAGFGIGRILHFDSVDDALGVVPGVLKDGDVVWVKGSRRARLDRLVDRLTDPGVTVPS